MASRLIPLHRGLIDEAVATWALSTGAPPPAPLELFALLREDPSFAWLQPITRLIVDLEELSSKEFDVAGVREAIDRVSALLDGSDPNIAASYRAVLQRDVEHAGAHAELRGALKRVNTILAAS
jgi:hypothetical protein